MKETANVKIVNFIIKNLWITFLINIKALFDSLVWIFDIAKALFNYKLSPIMIPKLPLDYSDFMLLIVSVILYFVLKSVVKLKVETETLANGINNGFTIITDNLNDSHRINDLKIRYVDFRLENKKLENDAFVNKLHNAGFSKEDLVEIGVSDDFIKQNNEKLLPRIVIDKYKDFKNELRKHNNSK